MRGESGQVLLEYLLMIVFGVLPFLILAHYFVKYLGYLYYVADLIFKVPFM